MENKQQKFGKSRQQSQWDITDASFNETRHVPLAINRTTVLKKPS